MNARAQLLFRMITVMLSIAAISVVWVLNQAGQTQEAPRDVLITYDLNQIGNGEFRLLDCCEQQAKILLIQDDEGRRYAYRLALKQSGFALPNSAQTCLKLAPEVHPDTRKLRPNARILCHDQTPSQWSWLLNGSPSNSEVSRLVSLSFERKGAILYVYGD